MFCKTKRLKLKRRYASSIIYVEIFIDIYLDMTVNLFMRKHRSRRWKQVLNDLVKLYINLGYKKQEILACLLLIHRKRLSFRHLKRVLAKKKCLSRGTNATDIDVKINVEMYVDIHFEIKESSFCSP